jgi:hypothetical protein
MVFRMKRNNTFLLIFFLLMQIVYSQEKELAGKIIVNDGSPKNVHIVNVANEKEVVSDAEGNFRILAETEDVLVLSAQHLEFQRLIVEKEIYDAGKFEITMILKATELEEVKIVTYNHINAVNLRILPKEPKRYTPAERKLRTAGDFKPIQLLGIIAGGMEFDPIINAINGKTKRLKQEVKLEKKELLIIKLNENYTDDFFKEEVKIAAEYITAFKYYLAEDTAFAEIFETNNTEMIAFAMSKRATEFNAAITAEKK